MMAVQVPENFGNYILKGIEEIHFSEPVAWLPEAPGWYGLGVLLLLWICRILARSFYRWRRNRYRRIALAHLAQLEDKINSNPVDAVSPLPELLKATALKAYSREIVAPLTGKNWLNFLDAQYNGPTFNDDLGRQLISIAYQPVEKWTIDAPTARSLIKRVKRWLRHHHEGLNEKVKGGCHV
jgi:hypothetical protein